MRSGKALFILSCFCLVYISGCAPPGDTKSLDPEVLDNKCRVYADMAVSQFRELGKYWCDQAGPEWSDDLAQHHAWCMQEDNHLLIGEQLIARGAVLMECRDKAEQAELSPIAGRCKAYAREAVSQVRKANKLSCGYKGALWGAEFDAHYNWCMQGENHRYINSMAAKRSKGLQQCSERGGGPVVAADSCVVYEKHQFQGRSMKIASGEKEEILNADGWDDAISSVRLAKGCHLEAWKQPKFNGSKLVLLKGHDSLGSQWDNQISSLKCTCGH